ncbi:hypothetical protein LUZ60_009461 [Juncus effusus]|nr:hypothetical protein LUZ60_009461 [Juncus effusus]
MLCSHDGQETQVLDDDSTQPDPGPPNSPINKDTLCEEINSPMNKYKVSEELNAPKNKDKLSEELNGPINKHKICEEMDDNILFGETQALDDDDYEWENKTQLYGDTQALDDPVETQLYDNTRALEDLVATQLYGETQVLEERDGVGIETRLIEDMGNWIETQLVEDGEEERERDGLEEREREGLEERERDGLEEREREGLEEREGDGLEEREREGLEERERDGLEERERDGLEERQRVDLEEREREGLEEREGDGLEEREGDGLEERERDGLEERERKDLEERERVDLEERERKDLEERERDGLEERERKDLEERERKDLEERERNGLEERERDGLEEREGDGLEEREGDGLEERERVDLEERERKDLEERERVDLDERERKDLEERERDGLEERERKDLEERERDGLEERERVDLEEIERKDLEERERKDLEERQRVDLEEREREGLEERERDGLEEREKDGLEERERKDLEERERVDLEERENSIEGCEEREWSADSDASTDDEACDSIHKRFSSLRVASLRSGALAANSNFNSKLNTFDPKKCTNNPLNQENVDTVTQKDELPTKSNNKTARQLFADVAPDTDCTVPVLSYVKSQEPGILSQANALELVDKLISSNDVGPTQDINNNNNNTHNNINRANNNIGAKLVKLARKAGSTSPARKKQIFDWGDSEDEGGGEFFKKNKDLLIEKSRGGKMKTVPLKGGERKKAKDLCLGMSDSRVVLSKRERACGEKKKKKLFDERENNGEVLERENDGNVLERENGEVGPDTQMAVEAIQELVHGSSGGPCPSKGRERKEESRGERVSDSRRKTRSATAKVAQETTERARTRSGKSVLQEGKIAKSEKKRKEVSKDSPVAKLSDRSQNSKKKQGNSGKSMVDLHRITRSCSKVTDLSGQNVITPDNLGQITKCKKKRTSYTISPSNSEKKKRVFIRSATELLAKAKRQKRVYSSNTEELILPDKGNDKNAAKISTPSRVINEKSPVFSPQKSARKTLSRSSVCRELLGLERTEKQAVKKWKDLRVRKDLTGARVLFSNHLDDNVIKQQKKILGRLGVVEASTISEATHFIADKFVRTRNMLEAIAMGKYVVIPAWLERCNLSNQYVDEKSFVLRDLKKEKEIGFCMTSSIAVASDSPLLKGKRVVVTRNVKPSQEVVTSLVLASGGQPMERIGRSLTKEEKVPDDVLVISCEEDYETCIPLLEKGGGIFSSELVLNGIIIQKLEFERHRLFSDHVKRTRSTIWLRDKQAGKFLPVAKCT